MSNPASAEQFSAAREAVPLVGEQQVRAAPKTSGHTIPVSNPDGVEYVGKLRILVALACGHDDREGPTLAVAGEMEFAGQAATATAKCFV